MLNFKKRIHIYEPIKDFLNTVVTIHGLIIKEISPEIAAESTLLPNDFHGDPADRIIVATTKVQGAILVTRDKEILNFSRSGYIKILRA
jgi:PIN domain nuclease of toxin-antitoxin system